MPLVMLAVLALSPLSISRAEEAVSPPEPAVSASTAADKEVQLKEIADMLGRLSDEEFLTVAPEGKTSRVEVLSAVYGTLAALQYRQALQAGPEEATRTQAEEALRGRAAQALAIDPETLVEAGWWTDLSANMKQKLKQKLETRTPSVALAVRGGRTLDAASMDKQTALEALLAQPDLPPAQRAALLFKKGKLYDELAALGASREPAEAPAPEAAAEPPKAAEKAPAAGPSEEEEVKAGTKELDALGKELQREIERRRAGPGGSSR